MSYGPATTAGTASPRGADGQYGSIPANLGYPEFLGPIQSNTCPTAVVPTS